LLGSLAWTGNFKLEFEKDTHQHLRVIAGINPYASALHLAAKNNFKTPEFIYAYSANGKGDASRNMHRWARNYRLPDGNGSRMTLLNNWESTYFDFDESKIAGLFKGAKELGVKLFLLDDGWFGNKYPRNDDKAGLGDWQENVKKLPHGLGYLVKEATNNGIKFGIWVEPEMVNPRSELYEKHRDWVIRQPQRPEYYFRNQLVLDLSNPQVQDFVFRTLDSLMIKSPGLAYIKWDCNAVMYNAYSQYLKKNNIPQSHLYVNYVLGLYDVLKRFRAKYPSLPMMLCSGGGGRVDYGGLQYFTEFWPSDNTDPMARIYIQWENSYFFPSIASCNHVTAWSNVSLKFKTDVAMMGKLGFDVDLNKLTAPEKEFANHSTIIYDSISDLVWHGDLYRLLDPWQNEKASLMYVDSQKTHAVVFNYLTSTGSFTHAQTAPVKLSGLDSKKNYRIREINLFPGDQPVIDQNEVYSGDFLIKQGINPAINKQRTSVVLNVEEIR
jgi:alpha-galactosidase